MTHTRKLRDDEGAFGRPGNFHRPCPKCHRYTVVAQTWDSNCGSYEDTRYTCKATDCGHVWWVDGPDA